MINVIDIMYVQWLIKIFITTSLLALSLQAQAIEIHLFDKQIDLSPSRPGNKSLCRHLFRVRMYGSKISTVSTAGFRQNAIQFFPENRPDPRTQKLIQEILKSWEDSGRYNENNLRYLRSREDSLSFLRTSYLAIKDAGHTSGIRKFDASTRVKNHGQDWFRSSIEEALSPIERIYNYRFPERMMAKDSYIWELGLLVSPSHFRGGASSAMANMAFLLDVHYNKIDYRTYGTTSRIADLNMQLYGVARPALVENYKKYGFEPVLVVDSLGVVKPFQFEDGLILIKVSGQRFIELNFDKPQHPATIIGGKAFDMKAIKEIEEGLRAMNRKVRDQEIPDFPSRDNWLFVWDQVMSQHLAAVESSAAGSLQRQNTYFDLVRSGYLMLKSPRAAENNPNIEAQRFFFKELLSEGPEAGLFMYKSYLKGDLGPNHADYASSHLRYDF